MLNLKEVHLNKQLNDKFRLFDEIDRTTSKIESQFNYNKNKVFLDYEKRTLNPKDKNSKLHFNIKCLKHSRNSSPDNRTTKASETYVNGKKSGGITSKSRDKHYCELIGENLYQKGLEFNLKKENDMKLKMKDLYKEMTFKPKISIYSSDLLQRDSNKFEQRLYQNFSKIEMSSTLSKEKLNITKDENLDNNSINQKVNKYNFDGSIYRPTPKKIRQEFNFQPKLNGYSLNLAKRSGWSREKSLLKDKSKSPNKYLNDSSMSCNSSKSFSLKRFEFDKKTLGHSLYHRAQRSLSKKRDKMDQSRKLSEREYLAYSFMPNTNYSSDIRDSMRSNKSSACNLSFYDRYDTYNNKKKSNMETIKSQIELGEKKVYTFQPKTNEKIMNQVDNEFFRKHYDRIMFYADKLRKYRINKVKQINNSTKQRGEIIQTGKRPQKLKTLSPRSSIENLREVFKTKSFFKSDYNDDSSDYFEELSKLDQDQFINAVRQIQKL